MGGIRLFLAIVVAIGHLCGELFPNIDDHVLLGINGNYAVILFFVVSGFLMSYVLDRKYAYDAAGTLAFYRSRFLRIYPLWWAMIAIVAVGVEPGWTRHPAIDYFTTLSLIGPDLQDSFHHAAMPGALGVGWSLAVEVLFYLVAPFLLRSTRASIVAFVALLASRSVAGWYYPSGEEWRSLNYLFFPHLLPFFLMGHFARLIWPRLRLPELAGIVPLAVAMAIMSHGFAFDTKRFYVATVCFALSLPAIFDLTKDVRWMNFCGDLTYPLYLVHTPMLRFAKGVSLHGADLGTQFVSSVKMLPTGAFIQFSAAATVFVTAALLVAYAAHCSIERPLHWLFDKILHFRYRAAALLRTLRSEVQTSRPS